MPRTTVELRLTLAYDEAHTESIRHEAEAEYGVPVAPGAPMGQVIAGIVHHTVYAQFYAFGTPIEIEGCTPVGRDSLTTG